MPYIYVIRPFNSYNPATEGYVGQATGSPEELYRIKQHVRKAYEVWPSEKLSGAATIIKRYGGSQVSIDIYDDKSGYGMGPAFEDAYTNFKLLGWTTADGSSMDDPNTKLTFAEILWIISGVGGMNLLGDISTYNKTIGDKSLFKYRVIDDEKLKNAIRTACTDLGLNLPDSKIFEDKDAGIGEAFITFGSTREDLIKLLNPKLYVCRRAFQVVLKAYSLHSQYYIDNFGKMIAKWMFSDDNNFSHLQKACEEYLQECCRQCSAEWYKVVRSIGLFTTSIGANLTNLNLGGIAKDVASFIKDAVEKQTVGSLLNQVRLLNENAQGEFFIKVTSCKINSKAQTTDQIATKNSKKQGRFKATGYSRVEMDITHDRIPTWYMQAINALDNAVKTPEERKSDPYHHTAMEIVRQASYDAFCQCYKAVADAKITEQLRQEGETLDSPTISTFMQEQTLNFKLQEAYQKLTKMNPNAAPLQNWDIYAARCLALYRQEKKLGPLTEQENDGSSGGWTSVLSPHTLVIYKFPIPIWGLVKSAQGSVNGLWGLKYF